jgi:uncharacterized membrane protein
LVEKLKAKR